jgi:hypothetical protein
VLERTKQHDGFKPANATVDGFEVYEWKAPSADPTATVLRGKIVVDGIATDPHQRAQALADSGLSPDPGAAAEAPAAQQPERPFGAFRNRSARPDPRNRPDFREDDGRSPRRRAVFR